MNTIGLTQMLGKTISGAVIKENNRKMNKGPGVQLRLVFVDRTNFEFHAGSYASISTASCVDPGGIEEARHYMSERMDIIFDAHLDENGRIVVTDHDQPAK